MGSIVDNFFFFTVRNALFDAETLDRLSVILDKSEGWVNLAELLDYGYLVTSIRNSASPSRMLLNYADVSSIYLVYF